MSIESVKLSEFFKCIKKPKYIIGTTYTLSLAFFESVVYPLVDRSALKYCLIISDNLGYQRSISEGPALQNANQTYLVVPAPITACFHPKVWLIVGENELALLAGSGNLTQSGFMSNAEIFDTLIFNSENPANNDCLLNIESFLSGLIEMWHKDDHGKLLCIDILKQIQDAISNISTIDSDENNSPQFVHSFKGPILNQLPNITECDDLFIAAPFFGGNSDGIKLLSNRYRSKRLHIFPAIHNGNITDIPIKKTLRELQPSTLAELDIPEKNNAHAHLKLYGLVSKKEGWIFCTSVNCTVAALNGPNIEAGILRKCSPKIVKGYFHKKAGVLPTGTLEYSSENISSKNLPIWAVNTGTKLEITVNAPSFSCLPLKDIEINVRLGSKIANYKKESFFNNSRTETLLWEDLPGLGQKRDATLCLKINGKSNQGIPVQGSCFVENQLLLNADPVHRSALRATLAVLYDNSIPQLADIAALFNMIESIYSGRILHQSTGLTNGGGEKKDQLEEPIYTALWPPTPVPAELQGKIGISGVSQLSLCQNIIGTFFKPNDLSDNISENFESNNQYEQDDDEFSDKNKKKPEREQEKYRKIAGNIWSFTFKDYQKLKSKLRTLIPKDNNAKDIWPLAVFVLLATLAIRKSVERIFPDTNATPINDLCDSFLLLMIDQRTQHPDYRCQPNLRYQSLPFPSLAIDLKKTFNVTPPPDLSIILLSLLVDQKVRKDPENRLPDLLWKNKIESIISNDFISDKNTKDRCKYYWQFYIMSKELTDGDFSAAYDYLTQIAGFKKKWEQFQNVRF